MNYESALHGYMLGARDRGLIEAIEIIPDGYAHGHLDRLRGVLDEVGLPYFFHFISNSLGSADFPQNNDVTQFRALLRDFEPLHYSDHLTCCRVGEIDLRQNLSLPRTRQMVDLVVDNIRHLKKSMRSKRPLLIENVVLDPLTYADPLSSSEFFSRIAVESDCEFLLDLHNVFVDEVNFGIDAEAFIASLPADRIHELHLAGGEWSTNKTVYFDSHTAPVPPRVLELLDFTLKRCEPRHVVYERIAIASPTLEAELEADLAAINQIVHP